MHVCLSFSLLNNTVQSKYNLFMPLIQASAINSVQNCRECSLTEHDKLGINDGVAPMQERMFTVQEVAQQLRVSERTVRNWVERGELRVFRIGKRGYRISESDLLAFIELRKQRE